MLERSGSTVPLRDDLVRYSNTQSHDNHMEIGIRGDQFVIQVTSSVLVHYLDSQTPPVQAELVGQEDRVRPDTRHLQRSEGLHKDISKYVECSQSTFFEPINQH